MTNFSRRILLPCSALALTALTQSAVAQVTSAQQSAIRSNCRSDFMSKCSGVQPGGKDALVCLQKNVASLSGACQTAVRATLPKEPAQAATPPAAASPPPAAATAALPPAAKPATIVSAPPPKAQTAKQPMKKPATAAVTPAPPPAPPSPPAVAAQPASAPAVVPGGVLVEKACARFILMHCRNVGFGTGPKVACMINYVKSGNTVGPRCMAALKVTGQLR
jgi:hypothetical protein